MAISTGDRPLSPHLQIYKLGITGNFSILHRATGVANAAGLLVLVYWLVSAAGGPESYASAAAVIDSFLGRLILFFWTASLYYHLCNGIRHLLWDTGWGFEMETVTQSAYVVAGAAAALTVLTWLGVFIAG